MGGLARRVSYEKLFKEKVGGIPALIVDSGNSFTSESNAHGGPRPDVQVKDDWILKSYDDFKVDVINVAAPDLRYVATLLAKPEYARHAGERPALKRMVSANTAGDAARAVSLPPFVVREVPARAANTKPVRVAFVGLTEAGDSLPHGFQINDPVETARRVVPEARKQSDLVIVLGYFKADTASRLAAQVPGIDAIIASNSQSEGTFFTPPLTVGPTLILFTSYETRMLGELRAYREASGKYSLRTRFITLDETFPDDAASMKLVNAARDAEEQTRGESKKLLESWLEASRNPTAAGGAGAAYISSQACAGCHQAQYIQWANSGHAHATDKLPPRWSEFQAGCLSCHATGQRTDATGKLVLARLQSVQCEQCHGPGGEHAQKPAKGYGRVGNVQQMCATCHTPEMSPKFDFASAWAKIKH
ncbi:MAG TPA: multiheme c-type cytochrome [Blastocatellia bacterium]|nr:multiheme c-type cytochrome [Blastocatellia bacterium]